MERRTNKLGETCVYIKTGKTPPTINNEYFNGTVNWFTPGDIGTSQYLVNSHKKITNKAILDKKAVIFEEGALLLTCIGEIGRCGILKSNASSNQQITALKFNESIEPRFAYYWFVHNKQKLERLANNAVVPILNNQALRIIDFSYPPLPVQKEIADTLDKADDIQRKDRELLLKFNELKKSIYLTHFGKGIEKFIPLSEVSDGDDGIKCGPFGTQLLASEFQNSGVPLWGIRHVNKSFRLATHEFLSEQKAKDLNSYSIIPGDLVMTRKGTIGNVCIYPKDFKAGIMHSDLLRIRVNKKYIHPLFLQFQFRYSNKLIDSIKQISNGAIMAGINVGKLKKLMIALPPMELQQKFINEIKVVEKMESCLAENNLKSSSLFDCLLSTYFK